MPSLSEVFAAVEPTGLFVTDVEILRLHYAETLRHWRERFTVRSEEVKVLYDERFFRMWEFYLVLCEIGLSTAHAHGLPDAAYTVSRCHPNNA